MRLRVLAPMALCSLSLAPGCGVSADTFCADYVDALDARSVRCAGGTAHQFRTLFQLNDFCRDYKRALAAKTATFESGRATACLDALRQGSCDASPSPAACRDAFAGAGAAGSACRATFECGQGLFCDSVLGQPCPGTCRAYARLGEDCSGTTSCAPEHNCDTSKTPLKCVANVGLGGACSASAGTSCGLPLFCGADGTCTAPQTSGACSSQRECSAKARCASGAGGKTCALRKKKGEACVDGQRECELGLTCNPTAGMTCTELAAIGAACTIGTGTVDGVDCAEGYCDTATAKCAAFKAPGAACTAFSFECGLVLCGGDGTCPASGGVCHVP